MMMKEMNTRIKTMMMNLKKTRQNRTKLQKKLLQRKPLIQQLKKLKKNTKTMRNI